MRLLRLFPALVVLLTTCAQPFGDLNNPYDPSNPNYVEVQAVALSRSHLNLAVSGPDGSLQATVVPSNATGQGLEWSSTDLRVATVDQGRVHPLAMGETSVVVTSLDGHRTASCLVSVVADPVPVTAVRLSPSTVTLAAGGVPATLEAWLEPSEATDQALAWTSSNPAVARVASGSVTPVSVGTATITATSRDGGKTASCAVTVVAQAVAVTGVNLLPATLSLVAGGEAFRMTTQFVPANATNTEVTWTSSKPAVATVDRGLVTALTPGSSTISVVTDDGGHEDTCLVTVTAAPIAVQGVLLTPSNLNLALGGAAGQLTATLVPADATNRGLTWASSHPEVATVAAGVVTAKIVGTTEVTVTTADGGYQATTSVTVTPALVAVTGVTLSPTSLARWAGGPSAQVVANLIPSNASNPGVTWTSSAPLVASVSEGTVTFLQAGSATLTATTADGAKKASCAVTVQPRPSLVTGLKATSGDSRVDLAWDTAFGATAYEVSWDEAFEAVVVDSGKTTVTSTTWAHTNVTNGHSFRYTVTALQGQDRTGASEAVMAAPSEFTYGVTYLGNGGDGLPPADPARYRAGASVALASGPGTLTRTGYLWTGWSVQASGGTVLAPGSSLTMPAHDLDLYARWVTPGTLRVTGLTAVAGDASATLQWDPLPAAQFYRIYAAPGASVTIDAGHLVGTASEPQFEATGLINAQTYAIAVTAVTSAGETSPSALAFVEPQASRYSVVYERNSATSGDVPVDAQTYLEGEEALVAGNSGHLVRTGYVFGGWNTDASGLGTTYRPGDPVVVPAGDLVLWALWTPLSTVRVQGLSARAGDGQVTLQWTALADATAYKVYKALGTKVSAIPSNLAGTTSETQFVVTGLTNDATYAFVVTGVTPGGDSAGSVAVTSIPRAPRFGVTYYPHGATSGTVPLDTATYQAGQLVTLADNTGELAREGYAFTGWSASADGSTPLLVPGDTYSMPAGPLGLWAQWVLLGSGSAGVTAPATLTVSVAGLADVVNDDVTLTATATASAAVDTWAWYLDGTLLTGKVGSGVSLAPGLSRSNHSLMVVATRGNLRATATRYFAVQKPPVLTGVSVSPPALASLSLSGLQTTLARASSMTVTASAGSPVQAWAWYLDGVALASTSAQAVLGPNLGSGQHTLMAVATVGGTWFTASTTFRVN